MASVSQDGRIEALSEGTTKITATSGNFSAECTVTVAASIEPYYQLTEVLVGSYGEFLSEIPPYNFDAIVYLDRNLPVSDASILLACYDSDGRFLQSYTKDISGFLSRKVLELVFQVQNSGDVAKVKAFAVSSMSELIPLSSAVEFANGQ